MSDNAATLCFVDSNVWLYAFIEGDDTDKTDAARALLQSNEILVSLQVVNEVCVNLIRKAAFTEDQIRELITAFFDKYAVIEMTESVLLEASELRERYSLSFWDGLILSSALTGGAGILYTEDMQHGLSVENRVEIINPFQQQN